MEQHVFMLLELNTGTLQLTYISFNPNMAL